MIPWLFAAAAVVYLVVGRRPERVPALPPLTPSLPSPPAPAAHVLHPAIVLGLVVPWFILAYSQFANHERPTPAPDPAPAYGLDLRGKFTGEHAAADAAITDALLAELADVIEWDGRQSPPRLTTGTQLADLRVAAREYRTRGVSLGARQPLARDAIKAFLDEEVGIDGGPVDEDRKSTRLNSSHVSESRMPSSA